MAAAGCSGPAGPQQYHLSGGVTFKGAPVEGGMIYFEPVEGNTGHAGFARISNGRYDTAAEGGKGHAGGKIAARIEPGANLQGPILDDNAPPPKKPFQVWQEVLDLPKSTSTHDFTVPDEADQPAAAPPPTRRATDP